MRRSEATLTWRGWQYVGSNLRSGAFCVPSDILSQRHLLVNKTELYVESLPLHNYDSQQQQDVYLRAIPAGNLVSLRLSRPDPPLTTRLEPLKRLLLRARRLRVLDYRDRGQGTHFRFDSASEGEGGEGEECQTLPPLEDLTLQSYDWNHGADAAARHWDFSRLRALRLVDVPAFNFLSSVDPERLAGLHTLRCDDFSAHLPVDRRADATRALRQLVGRIRALRVLEVTCHTHLFLPPTAAAATASSSPEHHNDDDPLLRHAPTLRTLRIRDHAGAGFSDEAAPPCPTLRAGYARRLTRRLRGLRSLELDFDARACDDPRGFLRALGAFPRLETLTLHVRTVLRPAGLFDDDDEEGGYPTSPADPRHHYHCRAGTPADPDRDAAQRTLAALVQARKEAGAAPWRRIALVVGGWRPVLGVRRGGEVWRALNARGVFAERCFVLERAGDGDGDAMLLREEVARRAEA
ncbi:hypothetical protein DL766_007374 [Monosporascus sp. MC13-8B]|uniref:FHA domain-containing protein n=1 Tax=Monosporascus cannonballus TaxID=155416 RepID=A0ABY0GSI6_9PEZI|nr:hypothetical protein DL762_009741 [Monosporascus cannonballus]RYO77521.1 hypothetical protein DL763_009959 [Monosporascus cannonballus]RYP24075.1 hypothetical protein DL766_007374 [Monosporascus sp. MC13-8B]